MFSAAGLQSLPNLLLDEFNIVVIASISHLKTTIDQVTPSVDAEVLGLIPATGIFFICGKHAAFTLLDVSK